MTFSLELANTTATEQLGGSLARCLGMGGVVFLHGDLGAGKTTLVRGFLHALGHEGVVKSPTYTLVEPYETRSGPVFHFDLYRVRDPEELEFMGVRDFFSPHSRCLVEWPQRGEGFLPTADMTITLEPWGEGRRALAEARTTAGVETLKCLTG